MTYPGSGTWGSFAGNFSDNLTMEVLKDGVTFTGDWTANVHMPGTPYADNVQMSIDVATGSHDYSWYLSGTNHYNGHVVTWVGSVSDYDPGAYGLGGEDPMSDPGNGVWPTGGPALAVEITSGPSAVDTTVGGTWVAEATGGTSPYTYMWSYGLTSGFPANATYVAGDTLEVVLAAGTNTVQVVATDDDDSTDSDSMSVVSSDQVAEYHVHLTRYGSVGQYVDVTAWDSVGQPIEIEGTDNTEVGVYVGEGGFGWYSSAEAVEVVASWAWRYTLSITIGEAVAPPAADMWFRSDVDVGSVVVSVVHHFVGIGENVDIWGDGDGVVIDPEVPPEEEAAEDPMVKWLKEMLLWFWGKVAEGLKWLFVPTEAQMTYLMPSGLMGASLLEDTDWDTVTKGTSWTMNAHWDGNEVPLVSLDMATLASSGFVVAVRTIVQAGMCLALVYMVVVLL
jgi:hypothetical protein